MSAQLKVLHVASWYPSEVHPSLGNFIARHVEAVATACEVEVWAPVPVRGSASSVVKMREKNGTELREEEGQTMWRPPPVLQPWRGPRNGACPWC